MKITFGDQAVEVRPWGGAGSGKALLVTRDPVIKGKILAQMNEFPDAFETLSGEYEVEDFSGPMMVVTDARKVGLFFDLEFMRPGLCVCEEYEEDVAYAGT